MEKISINIVVELGNEGMSTCGQVARAVKGKMEDVYEVIRGGFNADGKVFDINGNSVGTWAVRND